MNEKEYTKRQFGQCLEISNTINEFLNQMHITIPQRVIISICLKEQTRICMEEIYKEEKKPKNQIKNFFKSTKKVIIELFENDKYREKYREHIKQNKQNEKDIPSYVN